MLSSHRIIKATQTYKGTKPSMIDTAMEMIEEETLEEIEDAADVSSMPSKIREARLKSEALLQEAEIKSRQLLEAAEQDADHLRTAAHAEGYASGEQAGYQAGYEKGFEDGMNQAQLESESMKRQAQALLEEAHAEIQLYQSEKKEELLDLAVRMAEKLVHDQLIQSTDGILALAKPFFYQLNKEEELVTLSVHPASAAFVKENLDEVKAICPGTRFMVLADADLEENGLVIESSRAVVDLQVKKQLAGMLKELKEMERTADV